MAQAVSCQPLTAQSVSCQPLTAQSVSCQPLTAQAVSCQSVTAQTVRSRLPSPEPLAASLSPPSQLAASLSPPSQLAASLSLPRPWFSLEPAGLHARFVREWQWDMFFSQYFGFPLSVIPPTLPTHLHVSLTRRSNEGILEISQKAMLSRKLGSTGENSTYR
jgi:hypothetical protein